VNRVVLSGHGIEARRGTDFTLRVPAIEVRNSEALAVIGPNGAGKSTLLKTLALLEPPDRGVVRFKGEPVDFGRGRVLEIRRRMAVVFQEPLLSDRTVAQNVELGLRLRGIRGREPHVREWLGRLGIAHLADRQARSLSGGEAQRTSLARAFVLDPDILFLDEPLAALDAPTRGALLADLRRILSETGTAALFVTHDRNEALAIGDRVAVLMDGAIRQVDVPERVFAAPADEGIARFVGVETVLTGTVASTAEHLVSVDVQGVRIEAVGEATQGQHVLVCVRPEDIVLAGPDAPASSARNRLDGRVTGIIPLGFAYRIDVDCGIPVVAIGTRRSIREMGLEVGSRITASFKATAAHLIPRP
jgi:tungstate transport system ATP-binding protein